MRFPGKNRAKNDTGASQRVRPGYNEKPSHLRNSIEEVEKKGGANSGLAPPMESSCHTKKGGKDRERSLGFICLQGTPCEQSMIVIKWSRCSPRKESGAIQTGEEEQGKKGGENREDESDDSGRTKKKNPSEGPK